MAPAIGKLGRLRGFEEVTFAADASSSIGSFGDVRALQAVDVQLPPGWLKDDSLRQRAWEDRKDIQGPRGRAKMGLKCYLAPSGVPLNAAAANPSTPRTMLGRILKKVLLDGWVADKGDTAQAGSTTTVVNFTDGSLTSAGRAFSMPTGAGGAYEMREVSSVSTNAVTMKMATSNAQATSGIILNAETFYPGTPAIAGGLQFVLERAVRKQIIWMRGCQATGGFTIDLPQGQLPSITLQIEAADFALDYEASVTTPLAGSAIAAATYSDGDPQPFVKSEFLWQTAGTTTRQTLDTYEIKFTPSWGFEAVPSVSSGANGIGGWFPTKPEPLGTLTFKTRVDTSAPYDTQFHADMVAGTLKQAFIQIGNTSANVYGISLPCLQIIDVQPITSAGVLVGWQVTAKVLEDANATDKSTNLRAAPWRMHQS